MRGKNYKKTLKDPISEIWVGFNAPQFTVNPERYRSGNRTFDGFISFGGKTTPKNLGLALEDFAKFLKTLPNDTDYADYDEGDMCCG